MLSIYNVSHKMKNININKASSSALNFSSFPSIADRNASSMRPRMETSGKGAAPQQMSANRPNLNAQQHLRNPYIQSSNSQSQQSFSFSQGQLTQLSQNNTQFSQNSQDDNNASLDQVKNWKYNSQERENSLRRVSCFPPPRSSSCRDENSHSLVLSRPPSANGRVSDEIEQSIGRMDKGLSRLVLVLDSVQGDLLQINRSLKNICLETEEIRKKLSVQESQLQSMIKEEDSMKESILERLKTFTGNQKDEELLEALEKIPKNLMESLLKVKSDMRFTIAREVQSIYQGQKTLEHELLELRKMNSNSSLPRGRRSKNTNPSNRDPRHQVKARGRGRPRKNQEIPDDRSYYGHSYLESRKINKVHVVGKQENQSTEMQGSVSRIVIDIDDEDDWRMENFSQSQGSLKRIDDFTSREYCSKDRFDCYGVDVQDKELAQQIEKARRKRKLKSFM